MKFPIYLLSCLFAILSCTSDAEFAGAQGGNTSLAEYTLAVWKEWAQASDEGLWVNSPERQVVLREVSTLGGDAFALFYSPVDIAISGDTLFVTDSSTESVVCLNAATNELIWKFGEPGEGPGHFSGITHIAVSNSRVFVNNQQNSRITVLDKHGDYQGDISIATPYDLTVVNDTVLVVLSLAEGKLINLYHTVTLEKIDAFGEWETTLEQNVVYSNRNLYVTPLPDSRIAVGSFYESVITIYDLKNEQIETSFFRNTPLTPPANEGGILYIHCNDICSSSDSLLYVLLPVVTIDKTLSTCRGDMPRIASIGLIDRYTLDGRYCDTVLAPETCCGTIEINGDYIYAIDCLEGFIRIYEIIPAFV
ncbi:MAG: hypothetical protein KAR40_08565 [Candidatus Sabulitectum sp.]|nr:hypothetical protein [Candidatus Sabulitectum sp.]